MLYEECKGALLRQHCVHCTTLGSCEGARMVPIVELHMVSVVCVLLFTGWWRGVNRVVEGSLQGGRGEFTGW